MSSEFEIINQLLPEKDIIVALSLVPTDILS
jgi:hypothetical protein